MSIFWVFMAER